MDNQQAIALRALLDIVEEKANSFANGVSMYNSSKPDGSFSQHLNEAGLEIALEELKRIKNEYITAKSDVDNFLRQIEFS